MKTYDKGARVIWITGLSGAGKSTLAEEVVARLLEQKHPVIFLDGDELREIFGAVAANADNHGREGRLTLAMQYAHLCRILVKQGQTVVIATISLFHEIHEWNRNNLPNYFEVYLKVPIDVLRKRDPKGIYRRFDTGEISNVAGLDLEVDEPRNADLIIEFDPSISVDYLASEVINNLEK